MIVSEDIFEVKRCVNAQRLSAEIQDELSGLTTKLDEKVDILKEGISPNITQTALVKIWKQEDVRLETSYGFESYRGYGQLCYIPRYLCGVRLNLKIKGTTNGVFAVGITVSLRDKDNVNTVLWQTSQSYNLNFVNGYGYLRHTDIINDVPLFGLPETAYVFIEVNDPYKLVTSGSNDVASMINTNLIVNSNAYKTVYYDANNNILVGDRNGYYVDFGLYIGEITDRKLGEVGNKIDSVVNSMSAEYELRRFFNRNFSLNTDTYPLGSYRGYGYLINAPKVFGGINANLMVKPEGSFSSSYSTDIEVHVSLRDKDTKSIIYEYTKPINADFVASDGFGKMINADILVDEPITNLPEQLYICIDIPIGYTMYTTTANVNNIFSDLAVLNDSYKNIYISPSNYYVVSDSIYKYACDFGVYDVSYVSKSVDNQPLYTLHDAFMKWSDGEKFPIAFAGDSTTDGYRTTDYVANVLGTNHTSGYLYTDVLQALLREETRNNTLRIYNAGFSGQTVSWMLANFDAEFGSDSSYSDVKMIGISFGINDRPHNDSQYKTFKSNIVELCKRCLRSNIQPFLLTSQAGAENSDVLGRYESKIISYANKAKWEVAKELNLEIIDVSTFTANFLNYSNQPIQTILYDYCHFADYGHKYEGGLLFKEIIPRVINVDGECRIGFETQGIKSDLQWGDTSVKQVQMLSETFEGFKTKALVSNRNDTTDIVIFDAWVFIDGKRPLTLKTYCGTINTLHCVLDNNNTVISNVSQTIGELDLGLHHIVIKSGSSANIDFYGCKLI